MHIFFNLVISQITKTLFKKETEMRLFTLFLAALNIATLGVYAEAVCESCIKRQQSHQDDLKSAGYYEDTEFYNSNLKDKNGKAADAKKDVNQAKREIPNKKK